ncbi:MAG: hypothetical protein J6X55_06205 [Victivallales bacterium]|nr:hypothetical protein [Victivallales bacterium]
MKKNDVNFILRIVRWIISGISIGLGLNSRAKRQPRKRRTGGGSKGYRN